jgi:hypothetical protein
MFQLLVMIHKYCIYLLSYRSQQNGENFETLFDERQAMLPPGHNQSGRLDRQCSGPMGDNHSWVMWRGDVTVSAEIE